MDLPAPVATQIKPQDPMQSMNMMAGIMDLQKSKQALKVGQETLAQAKIETQKQQEIRDFYQSFDPSEHVGPDGTTSLESAFADPAFKKLGMSKPAVIEQMQGMKQKQQAAKQALATLNSDVVHQFSSLAGTLSENPDIGTDAGTGAVADAFARFGELGPDNKRAVDLFGGLVTKTDPSHRQGALRAVQLMGADAATQRGQQNPQQFAMPDGTIGLRDPRSAQIWMPGERRYATPEEAQQAQPTQGQQGGEQPPAQPGPPAAPAGAGAPPVAGPPSAQPPAAPPGISPQAARHNIPSAVNAGNIARQTGAATQDIERGTQVSDLQQPSSAAIQTTRRVDELADQISASKIAGKVTEGLRHLGFTDIDAARTQLDKELGQLKGLAIARAGSDSRAATILEGYPTNTTPASTIHSAMDYFRGVAKQNIKRGSNLIEHQQADASLRGFQASDSVIANSTNPLQHEYASLPTAEKRAAFLKRNFSSKDDAQEFLHSIQGLKRHTKVLD